MHEVDVAFQAEVDVEEEELVGWAIDALDAMALDPCELSIVLVDDAQIRDLNRTWRDKDTPTDVLSFPQQAGGPGDITGGVLGDVVISVETAQKQADLLGHGLREELRVLIVHGICHLIGYDHEDSEDMGRMAALEAKVLGHIADGVQGLITRVEAVR